MTEYIRESNLIEGIDDPKMDKQSMKAWRWLIKQPSINHHVIQHLQKKITILQDDLLPEYRGYYRDKVKINVIVAGHVAPGHAFVRYMMDNWLIDYPSQSPLDNHRIFEYIHPFVDGNGRTGRMLMWYQQIKAGEEPLLIKFEEKAAYYKWFERVKIID